MLYETKTTTLVGVFTNKFPRLCKLLVIRPKWRYIVGENTNKGETNNGE